MTDTGRFERCRIGFQEEMDVWMGGFKKITGVAVAALLLGFAGTTPVLAETIRGNWVENRHRGAYVVVDADGTVVASAGDIDRPIFPRSAIKAMQALPIFARHAHGKFHHTEEELALACASHHGEDVHDDYGSGYNLHWLVEAMKLYRVPGLKLA